MSKFSDFTMFSTRKKMKMGVSGVVWLKNGSNRFFTDGTVPYSLTQLFRRNTVCFVNSVDPLQSFHVCLYRKVRAHPPAKANVEK